MTESSQIWARAHAALGPYGRLVRVENAAETGTPDVNYLLRRYPKVSPVCGWLELKLVPEWPARPTTTIKVDSLTREQVNWATSWALAGGRCFCLLQVGRTVMLLDHQTLGQLFAGAHRRTSLIDSALVSADGEFPAAAILKRLTE